MHALSKEHSFAQGPVPLELGHLASCSSRGAQLRSKGLFHWDSATLQLAPPMEQSFAQTILEVAPSKEHSFAQRASPTGTRPPCSLLLPWSKASLKCLSHWDSATLQFAPPVEHSLAQRASPTGTRPPCSFLLPWSTASRKCPPS
ncbi:hypothetical protein Adt_13506 [Abeliophyllum distichum]|uniref:Uncharacterized protein n=1 Tax=Abeliophyllum distichum TaxID=126358 RepID=A0ABD1TWZ9_9LAMI